ncbi:ribbon-helix-helix domain-containing protein [Acetobacter sp. DsW_063]|uniref:ribbon-helix-helix domain-containing protein n=1 Tax=Acetobacter sp. DsW_063 TaxID=1514894 RepID=UPI000A3A1E28|nr:ribbon-helix-helix domain-containing protein [Acetobacter sp. DsW_063]
MSRHLVKRSLVLSGHGTSVALEPEFWRAIDAIAMENKLGISQVVEAIDATRDPQRPLASALRVAALHHASGEGEAIWRQITVGAPSASAPDAAVDGDPDLADA